MIRLRPLTDEDIAAIRRWPPYPADMAQMDYAVREGGWLDEYRAVAEAFLYAADYDGDLVGFTILARTGSGEAEFRIALRSDRTGLGLGEEITGQTLQRGFAEHALSRIHLIVRTNNERGIRLYRRIGFTDRGECRREIRGTPVVFRVMEIDRERVSAMPAPEGKGDTNVGDTQESIDSH